MKSYDISGLNDSHFHILEMIDKNIDMIQFLDQWKTSKGEYLIDIGVDEYKLQERLKFSKDYNFIYHCVGIHPNSAGGNKKERMEIIEKSIIEENVIGIGETGLDYYWDTVKKSIQQEFLINHIELSIKYKLPIIIHNRDACEDLLKILKIYSGQITGIIHCFSSTEYYLKEFVKLGFFISYAGNITYKKNIELQETIKHVPINMLLIETDSPYLPPVPFRGKLNNPCYIGYTFNFIANKIVLDKANLKSILKNNLENIFNLSEAQ